MKKVLSFVFAAMFAVSVANAATLVSEDFSYADGDLVGNGGWTNHSGSESFIQVASGEAVLSHGGGSREDAGVTFTEVTSGVITATFDLTVADDAAISGSDSEYFAHFMSEGDFNFRARVDVVPGEDGGDYTLGIASTSSTAEAVLGVDFTFGDVVAVTLSYDLDTGFATLSAGGETESGSVQGTEAGLDRFALRQSNSSSDETITVDNLVITGDVTPIPEPSSVALVMLGAVAVSAVSMRSRLG